MEEKDLELIRSYTDRGWKLVRIPKGKKKATESGYQSDFTVDPESITGNVGVLLGEPSGWLIDIDLDWREAAELADSFLPPTGAIFGRTHSPDSHRLYTVPECGKRVAFQIASLKKKKTGMIVEFRANGGHTVFPPSLHESGDTVEWSTYEDPPSIDRKELLECCGRLAAACIFTRYWVEGVRQDLSMAIAGMLLKVDVPQDVIVHFIRTIATYAGDDDIPMKTNSVTRTAQTLAAGNEVTGYATIAEILGDERARLVSKWLNAVKDQEVPEGSILITNKASKRLAEEAWDALANWKNDEGPSLFIFGEEIARIEENIKVLSPEGFWQELNHRTDWVRKPGKKVFPDDAPTNTIKFMRHQRKAEVPLPKLEGLTNTPIMTDNGKIHITPGYSPESRFFLSPELEVPKISDKPNNKQVEAAKALLEEIICDFPFKDISDRAHALAMIILPFVRPMIKGPTPLHLLDKPVQGTGATLLAEIATEIKTGAAIAAQPAPKSGDDAEWQKIILSKLMQAPEFIFLDNVHNIYSDTLAMALTANAYEGRRLGASEMVTVPVRTTWIMTGNNVQMGPDFPRRVLQIRMDANLEDPTTRDQFKHPDLHGWIREERGKIVWAILTIARAWMIAGKEPGKIELASYNHWSKVLGGILNHINIAGFLETPIERKQANNAFSDDEHEFVRCWLAHVLKDPEYENVKPGILLKMCHACELDLGSGEKVTPSIFGKSRMLRMTDRVFNISDINGNEIRVKIERKKKNGNPSWGLVFVAKHDNIVLDDYWQGLFLQ